MAETENETKLPDGGDKPKAKKFTMLVFLACLLSAGSLIWTTYSLLDFFQIGGIDLAHMSLKELNPVGLSSAATADIAWSLTMIAEYRGVKIPVRKWGKGATGQYNIIPLIGWAEVLFVTTMLAIHGSSMGNGAAGFAAALPVLTKLSWMMALADLKDPEAPTEEEKALIAEQRRRANVRMEKIKATAAEHKAAMEEKRRQHEADLEDKRAEGERKLLEKQNEFALREQELRGANDLKALESRLHAELQMGILDSRAQISMMREDHEWNMAMRRHPQRTIVGQTIPQRSLVQGPTLEIDGDMQGSEMASTLDLASYGLTQAQQKQAALALSWYEVDAQFGGAVTKKMFVEQNKGHMPGLSAPRLSEATSAFPREWFAERGVVFQG